MAGLIVDDAQPRAAARFIRIDTVNFPDDFGAAAVRKLQNERGDAALAADGQFEIHRLKRALAQLLGDMRRHRRGSRHRAREQKCEARALASGIGELLFHIFLQKRADQRLELRPGQGGQLFGARVAEQPLEQVMHEAAIRQRVEFRLAARAGAQAVLAEIRKRALRERLRLRRRNPHAAAEKRFGPLDVPQTRGGLLGRAVEGLQARAVLRARKERAQCGLLGVFRAKPARQGGKGGVPAAREKARRQGLFRVYGHLPQRAAHLLDQRRRLLRRAVRRGRRPGKEQPLPARADRGIRQKALLHIDARERIVQRQAAFYEREPLGKAQHAGTTRRFREIAARGAEHEHDFRRFRADAVRRADGHLVDALGDAGERIALQNERQKLLKAAALDGRIAEHERALVQNLHQKVPQPHGVVGQSRSAARLKRRRERFEMRGDVCLFQKGIHSFRKLLPGRVGARLCKRQKRAHHRLPRRLEAFEPGAVFVRPRLGKAVRVHRKRLAPAPPGNAPHEAVIFKLRRALAVDARKAALHAGEDRFRIPMRAHGRKRRKDVPHKRFMRNVARLVHKTGDLILRKSGRKRAAVTVEVARHDDNVPRAAHLCGQKPADGRRRKGRLVVGVARGVNGYVFRLFLRGRMSPAEDAGLHRAQVVREKPRTRGEHFRRSDLDALLARAAQKGRSRLLDDREYPHAVRRVIQRIGTQRDRDVLRLAQGGAQNGVLLARKALVAVHKHRGVRKKRVRLERLRRAVQILARVKPRLMDQRAVGG